MTRKKQMGNYDKFPALLHYLGTTEIKYRSGIAEQNQQ